MIGIDTNILLRHTLQDDPVQAPIATAFPLDRERDAETALLNPVTLVEFVWTLMRRERFAKRDIVALLDVLMDSSAVAFPDRAATSAAIEDLRRGRADSQGYRIGHLNRTAGAAKTVTFDVRAAVEAPFALLQS